MSYFNFLSTMTLGNGFGVVADNREAFQGSFIQKPALLTYLSLALNKGFDRYVQLIRNKICNEEGISRVSSTQPPRIASRSQPAHPSLPKQESKLIQNHTHKVKKIDKKKYTKVEIKKPKIATQPQSNKKIKQTQQLQPQPKVNKNFSKKNKKLGEVKKEIMKKPVTIGMHQTAEMPRFGLGELQTRGIRDRLIMRRVYSWPSNVQIKRGRGELRTFL